MDGATKKYIETVKVSDIPWHRLTTTYGRATDFPDYLAVLWDMKNVEEQGHNDVARYLVKELAELFIIIAECIRDGLMLELLTEIDH